MKTQVALKEKAKKAGCETVREYYLWSCGYSDGVADLGEEITNKTETIPDHMNAAIAEGVEIERRNKLKDTREHYSDMSDRSAEDER